jgi:alginate O-acetyltransferase complex protein AlgJ
MIKTIGNRLCAYILIFLLVCGGPFLVLVLQSEKYAQGTIWPRTKIGFLNGEPSNKFDKLYKAAFPLKEFSVTLLNAISYVAFHEARKGAIIGNDGWIYTDEEFVWKSTSAASVESHINEILDVEATLASQGTRLAVVLVPQKSAIYPEHLGNVRIPLEQEQLYDTVRQKLLTRPQIILPDVKTALMGEKSSEDMFLHTDTHWTVGGAGVAAAIVAKSIPGELLGEVKQFKRVAAAPTTHHGDLLKFVDLGHWSGLLPVKEETIVPMTATNVEATVDEFLATPVVAKKQEEIVLVGTSYSANSLWSFQSQLELALGTNLVNRAEEGKGYAVPMKSFLESSNGDFKNVRLVIWEIPVRYLVVDEINSK